MHPRALALAALLTALTPAASAQVFHISLGGPPAAVEIADGVATLSVGPGGLLRFRVAEELLRELPEGWRVEGPLTLETAAGPLTLARADVLFERSASGAIERLRGKAEVPPPFASPRVTVASPAMAELGYDRGANLAHLGVPLLPESSYLFFRFDAGISVQIATGAEADATPPLTLSVPGGADGVMIQNPHDHFWFLGGSLLPEDHGGKAEELDGTTTGVGRSEQGWIPFVPRHVAGLEDRVQGFSGHRIEQGVIPVFDLPLELTGSFVTRVGFAGQGEDAIDPLGFGRGPSLRAGGNGDLAVAFPLAKAAGLALDFGFPLGDATCGVELVNDRQQAWFRGTLDPDTSWLPAVPLRPRAGAEVLGYLSTEWARSFLDARGHHGLDASFFGELVGLPMGDLLSSEGHLRLDADGVAFTGRTGSHLGPFVPRGDVEVEARLSASRPHLLALRGEFDVAGLRTSGELRLSEGAATLSGDLVVGHWLLDVAARLERDGEHGLALVGEFQVPGHFNDHLGHSIQTRAQAELDEAAARLAVLEEATRDYELEASLRGVRRALPAICDAGIRAIDTEVPKRVKAGWPKKFGVRAPGLKTGLARAAKEAKPWRDRLVRLKSLAAGGDDAALRAGLKKALGDVIANRRMTIRIPVAGTVYKGDLISAGNVAKLRPAIAAIDALPAASERRVSARAAWEAAAPNEGLQQAARAVEGVDGPRVERIGFRWPLREASTSRPVQVTVRVGGERRVLDYTCDLADPAALRDAIVADVMAGW